MIQVARKRCRAVFPDSCQECKHFVEDSVSQYRLEGWCRLFREKNGIYGFDPDAGIKLKGTFPPCLMWCFEAKEKEPR